MNGILVHVGGTGLGINLVILGPSAFVALLPLDRTRNVDRVVSAAHTGNVEHSRLPRSGWSILYNSTVGQGFKLNLKEIAGLKPA